MILDVNLPICTGWEVLDEAVDLFQNSPGLKPYIAICSSSIDLDDANKAKEREDVDAYIEKPLTVGKIEQLLEAYQMNVDVLIR